MGLFLVNHFHAMAATMVVMAMASFTSLAAGGWEDFLISLPWGTFAHISALEWSTCH